jgi:hypothetical protein
MRKKMLFLLILVLFAVAVEIPDVNVTGINITGLMVSVATKFMQVMRGIVKQILLTIANML